MRLQFRKANVNDISAMVILENQCFTSDKLSRDSFRYFIKSGKSDLIVALSAKNLMVGYFLILYRKNGRAGRLYSIAIHPNFQGRGLGFTFFKEIEKRIRIRGLGEVVLEVRPDNKVAQGLYLKMGFVQIAELPNFYEDQSKALRFRKVYF